MSVCRGCGKSIVFGITSEGRKIPLDPIPPVYDVDVEEDGTVTATRNPSAMISHFAMCKNANEFSSSAKQSEHGEKDKYFKMFFQGHRGVR